MHIPLLSTYTRWLHTKYPAGKPESLPEVNEDGSTNVTGLYIVGDLKGIPLLKFSTDSGAKAIDTIKEQSWFKNGKSSQEGVDLLIIGAGVAGVSAALRAKKLGLSYRIVEASQTFSTIVNFPKEKPIYTYPKEFIPDSELETTGEVKESLLEELLEQVRFNKIQVEENINIDKVIRKGGQMVSQVTGGEAIVSRAVIVAIGRSGNYRRLGIPGEELDKVSNRLHDPKEYSTKNVLVVGGGDSALETAIAIAEKGGSVILSYRKPEFSRPKPENRDRIHALASSEVAPGRIRLLMNSQPTRIDATSVTIKNNASKEEESYANDNVFAMIGREAPLDFFRKSGVAINGEWRPITILSFVAFLVFCTWLYLWKGGGGNPVSEYFATNNLFPWNLSGVFGSLTGPLAEMVNNPNHLLGTLAISIKSPAFYYTLAYSLAVVIFGIKRILKRKTPYITLQTLTLMSIQAFPLFLLPEIFFPWAGHNGWFDHGILNTIANGLFPEVGYGHGREYWRAYGLILAWPLFLYNFFTEQPMTWWLVLGSLQTFVIIPGMVFFWGKGAYCGWVCSCGALAETLGDNHRHKMPHGPFWNRLNMTGQVILVIALIGMGVQITAWFDGNSWAGHVMDKWYHGKPSIQQLVIADATFPENVEWNQVLNDDGTVKVDDYGEEVWKATVTTESGEIVPEDAVYYDFATGDPILGESTWEYNVAWQEDEEGREIPVAVDSSGNVIPDALPAFTSTYYPIERSTGPNYVSYKWVVDTLIAGIIGVGFYFWYSGRVWCRFACPLAALMHIYTKFSRFRIIADKKKCISCNVCTSVCHQGIDIMNFANKGVPMSDPECVRCSACVQSCPTGVLQFGQVDREGTVLSIDSLQASPVLMREREDANASKSSGE